MSIIFNANHPYLRVVLEFYDFITLYPFTKRERKIFDAVYRQTIGYQKKWDNISTYQLSLFTGLSQSACLTTLKRLTENKVITTKKSRRGYCVKINENFQHWALFPQLTDAWEQIKDFRSPKKIRKNNQNINPFDSEKPSENYPKRSDSTDKNNQNSDPFNSEKPSKIIKNYPKRSATIDKNKKEKKQQQNIPLISMPINNAKSKISGSFFSEIIDEKIKEQFSDIGSQTLKLMIQMLEKNNIPQKIQEDMLRTTNKAAAKGKIRLTPVHYLSGLITRFRDGLYIVETEIFTETQKEKEEKRKEEQRLMMKEEHESDQKEKEGKRLFELVKDELSPHEIKDYRLVFIQILRTNSPLFFNEFKKKGFAGLSFNMRFNHYLRQKLM